MSHHQPHHNPIPKRPLVKTMRPRSPHEVHRASTPLELLFDLVFVVAVALAAARLHHGIVENHTGHALQAYSMVFFAIWWAWLNFSWFASAYDVDDVPYRLLVLLQLTGALVLAAGVPLAFEEGNFMITVAGYVVMRIALTLQWLRAWRADVARRPIIVRYIVGLIVMQMAWVAYLFFPPSLKVAFFIVFAIGEMLVPVIAESKGFTPFHPEHIAERYGLFTIIVLGESILAASTAVQSALIDGHLDAQVLKIALGGILIVFSMWWSYFQQTEYNLTSSLRSTVLWGYGHYFIFASAAAVGAGLGVAVDYATGVTHISSVTAGLAVAVPAAIFCLSLGVVHGRLSAGGLMLTLFLTAIIATLVTPWLPDTTLWVGVILSVFLGINLWLNRGEAEEVTHH